MSPDSQSEDKFLPGMVLPECKRQCYLDYLCAGIDT